MDRLDELSPQIRGALIMSAAVVVMLITSVILLYEGSVKGSLTFQMLSLLYTVGIIFVLYHSQSQRGE